MVRLSLCLIFVFAGLTMVLTSCVSAPMEHCKTLCVNGKVESFKDDLQECRCRFPK